ncbi:hypothetical protein H2201_009140 [Coniosporium apollinis]|uniref:Uncharacterized protein n=1 Tax=Coniosporium apollinis TaxID=61459 RepID=A0ABQ9NHL6_9PEZI|nr:hypothetical protein H2201_009140 [Coniosporium apollinis]
MGHSSKRRRLMTAPLSSHADEDGKSLDHERHANKMRFERALERIFAKYSEDFSGVGDEIDLETGEIIVDNGHNVSHHQPGHHHHTNPIALPPRHGS